jgi:kinesin family protein 11
MNEKQAPASKSSHIKVAVRCRPLNAEERKTGQATVITNDQENKLIKVRTRVPRNFHFDEVFGMYSTQQEVFDSIVRPVLEECLCGFNCTMFAYGQTGTGKTHTMEGDITNPDDAGIIPRCAEAIFEKLNKMNYDYNVRISYLEICKFIVIVVINKVIYYSSLI